MSNAIVIDFTEYKGNPERRIEAGRHPVKVTSTEVVKTKNGDPMINVTYEIIGGIDKGKEFMDRLVIMDKTLFRIYGFLFALTGKKIDKKKLKVDPDKWLGKKLYITVSDQENNYQGRTTIQSNVDSYAKFEMNNDNVDKTLDNDIPPPAVEDIPDTSEIDDLADVDLADIDI